MKIVGIDVGSGFTNAYNGKSTVIFKSIIGGAAKPEELPLRRQNQTIKHDT